MKENISRLLTSTFESEDGEQAAAWNALSQQNKLFALYKKLMFLEINDTLKSDGFVKRYRRPIPLDGFSKNATSGFNVFLARSVKAVLQKFFKNLTAAGVLASPLPFSNGVNFSRDESYKDLSLCPLDHFPYKTFLPDAVNSASQTDFSSLADHQIKELFQNLTTFAPHSDEFGLFLREGCKDESLSDLAPGQASEINERIDISSKYHYSLHHSPPFESPLLLHSIVKERSSHSYSLTFCIRDTDYYNFLCDNWSLSWAASPSPFVTHSFVSGVNPGLWNIHWIYVNVDYAYLLPESGDLRSRLESGASPRTFDHFIDFFARLQDHFLTTFVEYYQHKFFTYASDYKTIYGSTLFDPSRVQYLSDFASNIRSFFNVVTHDPTPSASFARWKTLSTYLTELEPFLVLSRFVKIPLRQRDATSLFNEGASSSEDGKRPLFVFCAALANNNKEFISSEAVQAYLRPSSLLDFTSSPLRELTSDPTDTLSSDSSLEAPSSEPLLEPSLTLTEGSSLTTSHRMKELSTLSTLRMSSASIDNYIRVSGLLNPGVIESWASTAQSNLITSSTSDPE